ESGPGRAVPPAAASGAEPLHGRALGQPRRGGGDGVLARLRPRPRRLGRAEPDQSVERRELYGRPGRPVGRRIAQHQRRPRIVIAASAGGAAAAPRKPRTLLVLLILSGALNLCFIGGALWLRTHEPPRTPIRPQAFADDLKLTPQQRTGFEQYFHVMRARAQLMRAELEPIVSQAW